MSEAGLYRPVRIGTLALDGNLFLAPVAGYSDRAFRSICVEAGANFTYTEMVSAEALTRDSGKTELLMRRAPNETRYAVQLFGSDPDRVARGTRIALERANPECIDLNAGCPVPKVWKTGSGSALTRDPDRLRALVSAMVRAAAEVSDRPVPITVKIRSGWDDRVLSWREAAEAAIAGGALAVTLHPRTKAQGYEGTARRELIGELAELVHARYPGIPVFGSGDLFSPEDARSMLAETRCDGVMFARGAMGNPFIFSATRDLLVDGRYEPVPLERRLAAGWRELSLLVGDLGEGLACREMRKRFCAYAKGFPGGPALRANLVRASTVEEYRSIFAGAGLPVPALANSPPCV